MIDKSDEKESRKLLKKNTVGRLGCVLKTGEPYIVPVNYLFHDRCIYIHSMPGLKLSAMEANPRVCLQTDDVAEDGLQWQSVIVFGFFEKLDDAKKRKEILGEFYRCFPRFTPVEAVADTKDLMDKIVVFRIIIDRLTGVAEGF